MKKTFAPAIFTLLLLLVIASACRRGMCCGKIIGSITCIKGTDTINRATNPGSIGNITDSLNYYTQQEYTCTSSLGPYIYYGSYPTYGIEAIKKQEAEGYGCIPSEGGIYCN